MQSQVEVEKKQGDWSLHLILEESHLIKWKVMFVVVKGQGNNYFGVEMMMARAGSSSDWILIKI